MVRSTTLSLIVFLAACSWLGGEPEIRESVSVDVPASPTTGGNSISWNTYRNDEYGFEFLYPSEYVVRDYSTDTFRSKQREEGIHVIADPQDIHSFPYADGSCGGTEPDTYIRIKQLFDKTAPGEGFDGFVIRYRGMLPASIFLNENDVKVAYGIQNCQGHVEPDDLIDEIFHHYIQHKP